MKKLLTTAFFLSTFSAFAAGPAITNITKGDLNDVGREFAVNFSHTAVAAPETDGLWGVEVGVVGGMTRTPGFSDVVDKAGEDGSKFKNGYHAGLMARAHFPLDLFLELTALPERKISDVKVSSSSGSIGWNAGGFFELPLDLAIGASASTGKVSFDQTVSSVNSTIKMDAGSKVYWVAVSKTLLFFTPYLKAGFANTDANVKVSGSSTLFTYTTSQSQSASSSGKYVALGANLQFFFVKLGFEASQTIGVTRYSGKLSLDF